MSNKANRQLAVNLIAQIASFLVSFGISFFVTPYVTNKLGSDAYGFITLADNFVNYASLITIALNSMASRLLRLRYTRIRWMRPMCILIQYLSAIRYLQ